MSTRPLDTPQRDGKHPSYAIYQEYRTRQPRPSLDKEPEITPNSTRSTASRTVGRMVRRIVLSFLSRWTTTKEKEKATE